MENISCLETHLKIQDFMTCIDLKDAHISVHVQVLTRVPLFPLERPIIYLPGPTIWVKYSSQGIYKADETLNRLSAEGRYSNSRLPRRLPNPGLLHRRVKSQHSANTGLHTVARFHKLGEIHCGPHSVIDIPGPLNKLSDNVAQPHREKGPDHTKQMLKDPFDTARPSGRPPPLQVFTNATHKKIPTGRLNSRTTNACP